MVTKAKRAKEVRVFCRKIMATALLFLLFPVLCAGVGAATDKEDILGFLAG